MSHLSFDILYQSLLISGTVLLLMMMIEGIHVWTKGKWIALMDKKPFWQIVLSALLGVTPGCVGVFAVVSLYTHNIIGFGALLAACIASFGDEAFFMLSLMPKQAGIVGGSLLLIGIVSGLVFQKIRPFQAMTHPHQIGHLSLHPEEGGHDCHARSGEGKAHPLLHRLLLIAGILLFLTGLFTGVLGEAGEDGSIDGESIAFIAIACCALPLACLTSDHFIEEHLWEHILKKHLLKIFLWTFGVIALLSLLTHYLDLEALPMRDSGKLLLLLIALGIGLIPQSGPHLAIVYLFAEGIVPLSTLMANCLLQEGHGGIPLMAESPKAFMRLKAVKFLMAAAIGLIGIATGW
ncbi:MAG: arsenic efflux protein [Bacteroidales bacterium]|nr:arsenic efflux protein [Bacteroidales bacterium]